MIKILVDSASDCRNNRSIFHTVVPITVSLGGTEYTDGENLDADTFYRLLAETKEFPKTAQPSPQQFAEVFQQIKDSDDELIYFSISSALSGTFQSATIAKDMVDCDRIHLFDTKTATHAVNFLAGYAVHMANQGATVSEILTTCEDLKGKVKLLAGVDTLEYLYRGGRLTKASAAVGELARVKPIITITSEGTVSMIGKSLGKAGSMQLIAKQLAGFHVDKRFPLYSLYTYGEENCKQLEQTLEEKGYPIAGRLQVGASIGAHVGPGVYGVLFVTE